MVTFARSLRTLAIVLPSVRSRRIESPNPWRLRVFARRCRRLTAWFGRLGFPRACAAARSWLSLMPLSAIVIRKVNGSASPGRQAQRREQRQKNQVDWLHQRTGATGREPATFGFAERRFSGRGAGSRARPAPVPAPEQERLTASLWRSCPLNHARPRYPGPRFGPCVRRPRHPEEVG